MPPKKSNSQFKSLRLREETGKDPLRQNKWTTPPSSPKQSPRSPPPPPQKKRRERSPPAGGGAGMRGGAIASYKDGGLVKKTGLAKLHKGEVIVPVNKVASVDKALKNAGLKPLKK